jgi:hypothetical protein
VPTGTYLINRPGLEDAGVNGDLDVYSNVQMIGQGSPAPIIDGNLLDRVIHVSGTATVELSNLTLRRGRAPGFNGAGGGVHVQGATAVLDHVTLISNTAGGGALSNVGGVVTVDNSLIQGNTASNGAGGIVNWLTGTLTLRNSDLVGNSGAIDNLSWGRMIVISSRILSSTGTLPAVSNEPGNTEGHLELVNSLIMGSLIGLRNGGYLTVTGSALVSNTAQGLYNNAGIARLANVTLAHNGTGAFVVGGTVQLANVTVARQTSYGVQAISLGEVIVRNTLLAGNATECNGALSSQGYNLVEGICSLSGGTGDVLGHSAELGPLTFVGVSPPYLPLQEGSAAIDAGHPDGCKDWLDQLLLSDQRGSSRNGRCDIGAFEFTSAEPPTATPTATPTKTPTATPTPTPTETPTVPLWLFLPLLTWHG